MSAQPELRVNVRDRLRRADKNYKLPFNPRFLRDEFQGNTDMPKQDMQAWFVSDGILPHLKSWKAECLDVEERLTELREELGDTDEWVDCIDPIIQHRKDADILLPDAETEGWTAPKLCCRAAASIVRDDPKEGILSTYGQNSDWGYVAATRILYTVLFDLLNVPKGFFFEMLGGKCIGIPMLERRAEARAAATRVEKRHLSQSSGEEGGSPPRSIKSRKQNLAQESDDEDGADLGAIDDGGVPVAPPTPTTARPAGAVPVNLAGNPAPAVSGPANPAPPPAPVAQMVPAPQVVPALPPYGIPPAVDAVLRHAETMIAAYQSKAETAEALLAEERARRQRLEVLVVEERAARQRTEVLLAEERADRQLVELRADPLLVEAMATRHRLEMQLAAETAARQRAEFQRDMAELQALAAQSQIPIPGDADVQNPENHPQL